MTTLLGGYPKWEVDDTIDPPTDASFGAVVVAEDVSVYTHRVQLLTGTPPDPEAVLCGSLVLYQPDQEPDTEHTFVVLAGETVADRDLPGREVEVSRHIMCWWKVGDNNSRVVGPFPITVPSSRRLDPDPPGVPHSTSDPSIDFTSPLRELGAYTINAGTWSGDVDTAIARNYHIQTTEDDTDPIPTLVTEASTGTVPASTAGKFFRIREQVTGLDGEDYYAFSIWILVEAVTVLEPVLIAGHRVVGTTTSTDIIPDVVLPNGLVEADVQFYWTMSDLDGQSVAVEPAFPVGVDPAGHVAPVQTGSPGEIYFQRETDVETAAPARWKQGWKLLRGEDAPDSTRATIDDTQRRHDVSVSYKLVDGGGNPIGELAPWCTPFSVEWATGGGNPSPVEGVWSRMPIMTAAEAAANFIGGEGGQWWLDMILDPSDPTKAWGAGDMNHVWYGEINPDTGRFFWRQANNLGLWCYMIQSINKHPTTGDVFVIASSGYDQRNMQRQGVYRLPGGDPDGVWEQVITVNRVMSQANQPTLIDFDANGRVVLIIPRREQTNVWYDSLLYRSNTTSGAAGTWTQVAALAYNTFDCPNHLKCHKTNANYMLMSMGWELAQQRGLRRSSNGGASWQLLSGTGGLPTGRINNVEVGLTTNPNAAYVAIENDAVYFTSDWTAGTPSWTRIAVPAGFVVSKVYVSPIDFGTSTARLWIVGRGSPPRTSGNNGATWQNCTVEFLPGWGNGNWTGLVQDKDGTGNHRPGCIFRPDPTNKTRALIHCNGACKLTTNATIIQWANEGFSGWAASYGNGIIFSPSDPDYMIVGVFDQGCGVSVDGGVTFQIISPNVARPPGYPGTGNLHKSMHCVTHPHPTSGAMISTLGVKGTGLVLIRSTTPFNNGSWTVVQPDDRGSRTFTHRHWTKPNRVYDRFNISNNDGVSWGGVPVSVVAVYPPNNDIVYGHVWSGTTTTISRSVNEGGSWPALVSFNWDIRWPDTRSLVLTPDPNDSTRIWTIDANKELATWSPSGGWRSYDLIARTIAAAAADGVTVPADVGRGVVSIVVDPADSDRVIALVQITGASAVWESRNALAATPTWTQLPGIPRGPALLSINPHTREIYHRGEGIGTHRLPYAA